MQESAGSEVGRIEATLVEGAPQIRLIGECDMATAPALQAMVDALLTQGQSRIVFDLQQVTFLDSSVLRIFLNARREAIPLGGEVVLLCRPGFVRRLLTLLEMDRLLRICTPEEWRDHVAALN
jgi:anti-sigma B factor antagonist